MIEPRLPLVRRYFLNKAFAEANTTTHPELWDSLLVLTSGMFWTRIILYCTICDANSRLTGLIAGRVSPSLAQCRKEAIVSKAS